MPSASIVVVGEICEICSGKEERGVAARGHQKSGSQQCYKLFNWLNTNHFGGKFLTCFKSKTYRDNEGGKAAAEVDDCGHVVPLGGKAQHNRAEQSGQRSSSSSSTVLSRCACTGVPSRLCQATGNGQRATAPVGDRLGGTVTGIGNTTRSERVYENCTKTKQSTRINKPKIPKYR